jgi:hypothetical protein
MSSQTNIEYELQVSYNDRDWDKLDFIFEHLSSYDLKKEMKDRKKQHKAKNRKIIHYRFISFDSANREDTTSVEWQV